MCSFPGAFRVDVSLQNIKGKAFSFSLTICFAPMLLASFQVLKVRSRPSWRTLILFFCKPPAVVVEVGETFQPHLILSLLHLMVSAPQQCHFLLEMCFCLQHRIPDVCSLQCRSQPYLHSSDYLILVSGLFLFPFASLFLSNKKKQKLLNVSAIFNFYKK